MTFDQIERERKEAGIPCHRLARAANVHPTTYYRLQQRPNHSGMTSTLDKLRGALDVLRRQEASGGVAIEPHPDG